MTNSDYERVEARLHAAGALWRSTFEQPPTFDRMAMPAMQPRRRATRRGIAVLVAAASVVAITAAISFSASRGGRQDSIATNSHLTLTLAPTTVLSPTPPQASETPGVSGSSHDSGTCAYSVSSVTPLRTIGLSGTVHLVTGDRTGGVFNAANLRLELFNESGQTRRIVGYGTLSLVNDSGCIVSTSAIPTSTLIPEPVALINLHTREMPIFTQGAAWLNDTELVSPGKYTFIAIIELLSEDSTTTSRLRTDSFSLNVDAKGDFGSN